MRYLKSVLVLLGLTVAMYVGTFLVLSRVKVKGTPLIYITTDYYTWPGGDTWQRFQEFDPKVRHDAIIIGSSQAYRGYDPYVFQEHGFKVFNLGSNAQTPLNTYPLIEHFLDSAHCPLLIFDVSIGTFASTGLESTADLTQNQPSDAAAMDMAVAMRDLRGLNMLTLRTLARRDKPYYTSPNYQGLGFCAYSDSINTEASLQPVRQKDILPRQRHYFEACVRLCHERGIRLVVTSPYARRDRRGSAHLVLATYMDSVLTGTGVPYLDYTDSPGIDDLHWFADEGHLNTTGARIFTGHLMDSLESLGYLRKP